MAEQLVRQRALARRMLTLTAKKVDKMITENRSSRVVKICLEELEKVYSQLIEVEEKSFVAGSETLEADTERYLEIYFDVKAKATDYVMEDELLRSPSRMSSGAGSNMSIPDFNDEPCNPDNTAVSETNNGFFGSNITQLNLCNVSQNNISNHNASAESILSIPQVQVNSNCPPTASEVNNCNLSNQNNNVHNIGAPLSFPGAAASPFYFGSTLPTLHLPNFSGGYFEWVTFRDIFLSVIDRDYRLTDVHKLHYLKTSLKGEAAALLSSIPTGAHNYRLAWERLNARFDRQGILVDSYVSKILKFKDLTSNSSELGKRVDQIEEVLGALEVMGDYGKSRDPWIIRIILERIDDDSRRLWATKSADLIVPTLEIFREFLGKRRRALEQLSFSAISKPSHSSNNNKINQKSSDKNSSIEKVKSLTASFKSCPLCAKGHRLYQCYRFKSFSGEDRKKKAAELSVCINCLHLGHVATDCPSGFKCATCKQSHHTLLHTEENDGRSVLCSNLGKSQKFHSGSLLATAVVFIESSYGTRVPCRVLLDSGSEVSLITENCVRRLSLKQFKVNVSISGIAESSSEVSRGLVNLKLFSKFDKSISLDLQAFILSRITSNLPGQDLNFNLFSSINSLPLADPSFFKSAPIDILIGIDSYFEVLRGVPHKIESNYWLQETIFGWVISGGLISRKNDLRVHSVLLGKIEKLDETLQSFWEVEDIPSEVALSEEENYCEEYFTKTQKRLSSGRYQVRLPFKPITENLGKSEAIAFRRFKQLQFRFQKDKQFHSKYIEFMNLYSSKNYMEQVPKNEIFSSKPVCYLPHHGVLQNKLRVVFDASVKTSSGYSLNDLLCPGPNLQLNPLRILLSFRCFRWVFSTDIEKMFLNIDLHPSDRDFQRLLWKDEGSDHITQYRMTTVTFGVVSSPYLAMRVLRQLAKDEEGKYPLASNILFNNVYMDDIMTGANSIDELKIIQNELIDIMKSAGFTLKKWVSNCTQIFKNVNSSDLAMNVSNFGEGSFVKSLGLFWNPKEDYFSFKINLDDVPKMTKRSLLSESSRIYDPFGWLSPTTVFIKQLFQQLWSRKVGWDEDLPDDILKKWSKIRSELKLFENIKLTRWLSLDKDHKIELVGFSDASERAYGAVIYMRHISLDGKTFVNLLISKTKVSPLKGLTIPRLELCAAHLLTRLMKFTLSCFDNPLSHFCYSDSRVVLSWLKKSPSLLKTYVGNRVSQIQRMLPSAEWMYVPTGENPADLASRGLSPAELLVKNLWWHGPSWLADPIIGGFPFQDLCDTLPEIKRTNLKSLTLELSDFKLINKYSSLDKLLRVTACCLRFAKLCRRQSISDSQVEQIDSAMEKLILCEQTRFYSESKLRLVSGKALKSRDSLLPLNPFIDPKCLLRVGGRLKDSSLPYDGKYPIIVPKDSYLSELIILKEHIGCNHLGTNTTLASIRQRFWIPNARSKVRPLIHKCIKCFKVKPKASNQLTGQLPDMRVNPSCVFSKVGIDYAGPFFIIPTRRRGNTTVKIYVAIFVCLVTKAVHIEYVSSLDSDSCLAAINRFASRRGRPKEIWSDHGTNFVAARRILDTTIDILLSEEFNENISHKLSVDRINWKFIPPRAPEFGGLWEAAVKSFKGCLYKTIGNSRLTLEEFTTLLAQIESSLNSRPLCHISDDPNDWEVLTPGHFITGKNMKRISELDAEGNQITLEARWRNLQNLFKSFWCRWSREYLTSLNPRSKNKIARENIKIGQVGVIIDDSKPNQWLLAKVINTIPGPDGLVRVVDLLTKNQKTVRRPISKFSPLPINDFVSENISETAVDDVEDALT